LDDKQGPLVRVQYLDKQGLISRWLPVKQFGSRSTMHLYVPKIGDDVNVNMLPNSSEDGFVDGSFFNKNNPPPAGVDLDTRHYKTEDGTVIEYRENDSTFRLDVGGATARTGQGRQSRLWSDCDCGRHSAYGKHYDQRRAHGC
jgi:phage baseplate assembly protein gpV